MQSCETVHDNIRARENVVKTARSIEEQEERKQARDDSDKGEISPASTPPVRQKSNQRDASRIAAWRWKRGQSGNPTGIRHDIAKEIAQAIFVNNADMIYAA